MTDRERFGIDALIPTDPHQLDSYCDRITLPNLDRGDSLRASSPLAVHRAHIRDEWLKSVGPMPENGLLSAKTVARCGAGTLDIETVALETLPGYYVSATLYKPRTEKEPLPAVLFVCGHNREGRLAPAYRRAASLIASTGAAVLAIDSVGQGGRIDYFEDGLADEAVASPWQQHDYVGAQCLLTGITPGSLFVHDALCARDYLDARADIDSSRVGLTGCSGGGTLTAMLMMHAPERFAAAAPCCFITSRRAILAARRRQDAEQIWPGAVKSGLDHADALAAFSPKPVLLLTADSDFFPLEGTLESVEKARRFWYEEGLDENLSVFTDRSLHSYSEPMARAAAVFFALHLAGKTVRPDEPVQTALPPEALTALESVKDSLASLTPYDVVLRRHRALKAPHTKEDAAAFLAPMLKKRDYPLFLKRPNAPDQLFNLRAEPVLWRQEKDLYGFGLWITPADGTVSRAVVGLWDGGTQRYVEHIEEAMDLCDAGAGLLMLDLPGTGALSDGLYAPESPVWWWSRMVVIDDTLLVNGDSMPALRARAVARACEAARALAGDVPLSALAYGRFALYPHMAKLAGAPLDRIEEKLPCAGFEKLVEKRYYDYHDIRSYVLPGMLRHFDLDDLRRWNG